MINVFRFLKANKLEVFMAGLFQIAHVEYGITQHVFVLISTQVSFIHDAYDGADEGEYDTDDHIEFGITQRYLSYS